ncbi:MAG TPA: ATP-binding cassette domain-containing protein, partial [Candidatus Nanoarchaeia archaeon]|nr:ATP-binding cassette domain-containing protein [Candidatus Nanoarchaeia archaeon]
MGEGQPEAILVVKEAYKTFGQKQILQNISLDIKPGEIFGIIGVSGVGKTTLLELLIGFLKCDKGQVLFRSGEALSGTTVYRSVL